MTPPIVAAPTARFCARLGKGLLPNLPLFFARFPFAGLYDVEALQGLGKDVAEGAIGYDRAPFHVIRRVAPGPRFEAFIERSRLTRWCSIANRCASSRIR